MLLAAATDATYLPWCATAVLSCLEVTPAPVEVVVLHGGDLDAAAQRRFREVVDGAGGTVAFHAVDAAALAHLPTKGPRLGGRTSWFRVLLPELLDGYERVLYLDADVLALRSLEPLWATELGDDLFAGVPNVVADDMVGHVEGLGLDPRGGYCNAGVLLLNLEQLRVEGTAAAIAGFVAERGATPWFDQDALNVVGAGRWRRLDARWNAQNSFWFWPELAAATIGPEELRAAVDDPALLHFEGPAIMKPWHYLCPHPLVGRYQEVLGRTPWRSVPLEERTAATRVIRRLPSRYRLPCYARLRRVRG